MAFVTTADGTDIFYKDWGTGQPIVFSHGWPLSSDDWDNQMLFFLAQGYRVVAADRRGHGRSTQTPGGHDLDHYADDLAVVVEHLDLHDAIHVGHSTGGGEVVRYLARHGESRAAKAVLISAVPPLMVQTEANPEGLPKSVFDGLQAQLAANRSEFYRALPSGPFYNFDKPGVESSEAIVENWWRQGMMGDALSHYDGIVASFADRLHRGPEEDHGAHLGDAQRRRSDRAVRGGRAEVGRTVGQRHAQDLPGRLPARHAHHARRRDQRRPVGLPERLTSTSSRRPARSRAATRATSHAGSVELRNLQYFVAVADEGSFTRAAARLYVTQPTVSAQIQALERELGEPLFDRLPRSVELSDGGRLLLPYARQCIAAAEDAKAEFSARGSLIRGELRLGTGGGVENGAVPAILGAFHQKYPGVDVELVEATSSPLVDLVLGGRLHAAVVAETLQPLPAGLASATMFTDQLVAVFDPAHFAFEGAAVALDAIARQPLITYPPTSALRATLDASADDVSAALNVRFVANDVRLQIALVRQGIGVAVSAGSDPALVGLDDLEIRPLDPAVHFSKAVVWRNDVRPGAPLRAFLDLWESGVAAQC